MSVSKLKGEGHHYKEVLFDLLFWPCISILMSGFNVATLFGMTMLMQAIMTCFPLKVQGEPLESVV